MRIKERRHRNTNPPWSGGGLTAAVFFGSRPDEAAGLLAADGSLTTCNVWRGAEIYIFAVSFSFSLFCNSTWILLRCSPTVCWSQSSYVCDHRLRWRLSRFPECTLVDKVASSFAPMLHLILRWHRKLVYCSVHQRNRPTLAYLHFFFLIKVKWEATLCYI